MNLDPRRIAPIFLALVTACGPVVSGGGAPPLPLLVVSALLPPEPDLDEFDRMALCRRRARQNAQRYCRCHPLR